MGVDTSSGYAPLQAEGTLRETRPVTNITEGMEAVEKSLAMALERAAQVAELLDMAPVPEMAIGMAAGRAADRPPTLAERHTARLESLDGMAYRLTAQLSQIARTVEQLR